MEKRMFGISLAVVAVAFGVVADEPAAGEIVYPLYTVTVGEATTNSLDNAMVQVVSEAGGEAETVAFSMLSGNITTGTFKKLGRGFLQGSTGMSEFEGDLLIEEGAYIVTTNRQTGKCIQVKTSTRYKEADDYAGTAHLVISNGATLVIDTETVMNLTQRLTFGGEGLDGMGAICNESVPISGVNLLNTVFYNACVTMTGDALLCNRTTQRFGFGYCYFDLNGHTFTIRNLNGHAQQVICGVHFRTPGHVVLDDAEAYISANKSWDGTAENTITFTNSAYCRLYNVSTAEFPWTLIVGQDDLTMYSDSGGDKIWESTTKGCWRGPIRLNGNLTANCNNNDVLNLYGPISGEGGILIKNYWLRLHNAGNTFEGGLTVNANGHAILHADGAVPVGGGPIIVKSGGELAFSDENGMHNLPKVDWTVADGKSFVFTGSANGTIAALAKKGPGTLTFKGGMSVTGRTELVEGTLAVTPVRYSDEPGLLETSKKYASSNLGNFYKNGTFSSGATQTVETVQAYPYLGNKTSKPWWQKYHYVKTEGYIWNRTGEDVTWSFATCYAAKGKLLIDDEVVTDTDNCGGLWYYLCTNTVTLAPGPHKFELRAYNGTYSAGGARSAYRLWDVDNKRALSNDNVEVSITWQNDFGCVYDVNGNSSTNVADYAIPCNNYAAAWDGGDGFLFTRSDKSVAECGLATCSLFSNIVTSAGTVIDLGLCDTLEVPFIEGVTTVTNGGLTVSGAWTIGTEPVLAGNRLAVEGALAFGEDAGIVVEQATGHVPNSPEGGWTIAEAEGGITLPEDWQGRVEFPNGKYRLSLSGDGKRLMLEHFNGTILSIR